MFILLAHNTTGTKADGTSDYNVEIRINEHVISKMFVAGHLRDAGGAELLRKIADQWDKESKWISQESKTPTEQPSRASQKFYRPKRKKLA